MSFKVQRANAADQAIAEEQLLPDDVVDAMSEHDKIGYALAFRRAGMSYYQIMDVLKIENEEKTRQLVEIGIKNGRTEQTDLAREIELARLDRMMQSIWPAAVSGDRQAIETSVKIIDMRAKLLGLRAPVEVSGPDGGPIPLELKHAKEHLRSRFDSIAERRRERARAKSAQRH